MSRKVEDVQYPGYIVYWYWQPQSDKQYVGITKSGRIKSRSRGRYRGYKECAHLYAAIEKYGWDSFVKDVLQYGLTKEEAEEWERYYIAKWDLTNPEKGYNIQPGGIGAGGLSEEGRKRLSELNSGGLSPNARPVVAFTLTGEFEREFECMRDAERHYGLRQGTLIRGAVMGSSPRGGHYFRFKSDIGNLLRLPSEELVPYNNRSKLVGANANHAIPVVLFDKRTGKLVAEFGCAKDASAFAGTNISTCLCGRNKTCGNYIVRYARDVVGIDFLDDFKESEPKPNGKRVCQFSVDGDFLAEYASIRDAEIETGISHKAISNCVRHKTHTAGGYVWRLSGDPFSSPKTAWESRVANGRTCCIPVDQIDLATGNVIATHPSLSEAAIAVGSHKQNIRDVINHVDGHISAAGYGWRYHEE